MRAQSGQSLVEFALSSVVLLLLVGGLVDIGRAIYVTEVISNAAREGARHGAYFQAPTLTHPYLYDAQIKASVDAELAAASLPASALKNPGTTCPNPTDGNAFHNPPYASSAYPPTANQTWLYICYQNNPGLDFTSAPASGQSLQDVNVIVLFTYGPLTPLVSAQLGAFHLAANTHVTVGGS
ncbi:MAG TPA: TadE/TadG family type IV pilus assembly protein [Candidatus Dormibacteraeota bacterium]